MKKIVLFGGGTGLSTLLSSFKELNAELVIAVAISDNGGSTGKVRKYYDIPAPGDLRRVIIELSTNEKLKEVLNYRFDEQIENHTIGNLVLAALNDLNGSMSEAVKTYSELLGVEQKVYPISDDYANISAVMNDNTIVNGETQVCKNKAGIKKVFYDQEVKANPEILKEIETADLIIFSCGSLYTSLIPNLIIGPIQEAIKKSKATITYIANIMTQLGETDNYTLSDHINAIEKHTFPGIIDKIIVNSNFDINQELLGKYKEEQAEMVMIDKKKIDPAIEIIKGDFIVGKEHIRHDADKLRIKINEIIEGENGKDNNKPENIS